MSKKQSKPMLHLHWLWHRGPTAVLGVTRGMALCGARLLPPTEFTVDRQAAACPACHQRAANWDATQAAAKATLAGPQPALQGKAKAGPARVGKAKASKAASGLPNGAGGGTICALVKQNPRRQGTAKHQRMALLLQHNGKTVAEFLKAGGNPVTLKNAIAEKLVEVKP